MTLSEKFESVTADVRREAIAVLNAVPERYEFCHVLGELFDVGNGYTALYLSPSYQGIGFYSATITGEDENGSEEHFQLDEISTETLCSLADFFTEKNAIR